MQTISLEQLLQGTGASLVQQGTRAITAGVTTDSRAIRPGCLFVALSGERFDGNDFAQQAAEQGAAALVLSRACEGICADCSVVLVDDGLAALQSLAHWWRGQMEPLRVVGLTGSNGKTSTKDMCLAILRQVGRTQATYGNLNNHIGVPLSILASPADLDCAIWEMGMNHMGELAPLCEMTRPQLGIITHIGSAHIEFLGSRENIAHEKCTLARCLPAEGYLIYPAHDEYADYIASQTQAHCLPVGEGCAVSAQNIRMGAVASIFTLCIEGMGEVEVSLPVPGQHMITNSLLAAAAGWKSGCTLAQIAQGLQELALTKGRLACYQREGLTLVDDSYNANLDSMCAAIDTLASMQEDKGGCIAVLGQMGELGAHSLAMHEQVGRYVREARYKALIVLGGDSPELQALCQGAAPMPLCRRVESPAEAAEQLRQWVQAGDGILFKGSRQARVERVLNELYPDISSAH